MATIRTRSRIETDLPKDVREAVDRLILEPGHTYDDIKDWLSAKGYDISRSSIGRYGKRRFEAYQAIKQFEDHSRAITSGVSDGMPMEEAVGKMMLQKVMAALMDGSADVVENSRLIADVAKLQSSHIQLAKWKDDLEKRVLSVADTAEKIAKEGGLSDAAANEIKTGILGMVKK